MRVSKTQQRRDELSVLPDKRRTTAGRSTVGSTGEVDAMLSDQLLEDAACKPEEEKGAHSNAVETVKKFFLAFIFFDALVVFSYLREAWTDDDQGLDDGIEHFLEYGVAACFSVDIFMAAAVLMLLSKADSQWKGSNYRWEDKHAVIYLNLKCNMFSLFVLGCQRLFHARNDKRLVVFALLYIGLRMLKLKPLGQLEQEIRHAKESANDCERYNDLLLAWGVRRSSKTQKLMVYIFVISVFVALGVLLLADVCDSYPTLPVCPAPPSPAKTNLSGGPPSGDSVPGVPQPLFLAATKNHRLENAANGAAVGGATVGGAASLFLGPEMVPIGAAVGTEVGAIFGFASSR